MTPFRPVLLCGGLGSRMGELSDHLPKALMPFGAQCRLMDGSLHAAAAAGADETVVLLQHKAGDIIDHASRAWPQRGMTLNYCGRDEKPDSAFEKELGTAHALWLNRRHIRRQGARDVIVLHSDHIYQQDLLEYYRFHVESGAALTFSATNVDLRHVSLFGMLKLDEQRNVVDFVEKPSNPTRTTISAGVWIFRTDVLYNTLSKMMQCDGGGYDISKNLIPRIRSAGHVVKAFPFSGYWEDIGTPERYWTAHIKLLTNPNYHSLIGQLPATLPLENVGHHVHHQKGSVTHSVLSDTTQQRQMMSYSVISNCAGDIGAGANALVAYNCDQRLPVSGQRSGLFFNNKEVFRPTTQSLSEAGLVLS